MVVYLVIDKKHVVEGVYYHPESDFQEEVKDVFCDHIDLNKNKFDEQYRIEVRKGVNLKNML